MSLKEPLVTIVITTHNRPDMVARALASALHQTMEDLEAIVVDDGSREPVHLLETDPRVRVFRLEQPAGVCAARNVGVRETRGQWVTFLDDDDELLPEMLELSLSAVRNSDLPLPVSVLSGVEVVDESGKVLDSRVPVTLPRGSHYFLEGSEDGQSFRTQMSLVAPLAVVRGIGGWDEELRSWVHDDFFLRLNADCSIQGQPTVLYRQSRHSGQHMHTNLVARAKAMELTLRRHRDVFARYPRRHAHFMASAGITYLRAGRWLPAVRATTRALLIDPKRPKLFLWWLASVGGPHLLALRKRARQRYRSSFQRLIRRTGSLNP